MFRKAREHLARLRESPSSWSSVAHEEGHGDRNAAAREAVLLALQVDRRPEDAGLLRYVLAQEVLCHEDGETEGLMEALPLACYLVGSLRAVEDVVWLARAKTANFDTYCGLSRELLFGAGVAETIAYARRLGVDRDSVLAQLEEDGHPWCSQDEVDFFWQAVDDEYPATIAAVHPLTLASYAVAQDEASEGVAALERWLADVLRIAEEADRTEAVDARWAGHLVAELRESTADAGLQGRLDVVAARLPARGTP